jgi:hypothetical protein
MRWSIDNRCGRLIEIVMASRMTVDETTEFRARMWQVLSKVDGRAVIVVDMVRAEMFNQEVADRLLMMLRTDNPKVERSAYVLGAQGAFGYQVERIIREAVEGCDRTRAPHRQSFRDKREAERFAGEVLNEEERHRLAAFIDAMDDPSSWSPVPGRSS